MTATAYYAAERIRHSQALKSCLLVTEMQTLAEQVVNHFGYPGTIMVTLKKDRKNCNVWSRFHPAAGQMTIRGYRTAESWFTEDGAGHIKRHTRANFDRIELSPSMLQMKTFAHELAHCLHYRDYRRRYIGRIEAPPEKSHGPEHFAWVDKIVAYLTAEGKIQPHIMGLSEQLAQKQQKPSPFIEKLKAMPTLPHGALVGPTLTTAEAWWAALPEQQLCTKCGKTQHKDEFGMRKISETKFARQGYCRTCRKDYYNAKKQAA